MKEEMKKEEMKTGKGLESYHVIEICERDVEEKGGHLVLRPDCMEIHVPTISNPEGFAIVGKALRERFGLPDRDVDDVLDYITEVQLMEWMKNLVKRSRSRV